MINNRDEIIETIRMIEEENLDVRTITMGISLVDCIDNDIKWLTEGIASGKADADCKRILHFQQFVDCIGFG